MSGLRAALPAPWPITEEVFMSILDRVIRASLDKFRPPIHSLVNDGYDAVEVAALAAIDGKPDADGTLNPFERELTEGERAACTALVVALRERLHKEVDRLIDAAAAANA